MVIQPGSPAQAFPVEIPFLHDLGVEFLGMGNGEAQVALNLEHRHTNSWNVTHGGIVMTLLDVVMSMAGRSLDPDARGGVTVEMKTSFLQPAGQPGGRVVAKGRAFHKSMTLCFCEGELWSGDKLVAKSMGTFKYLKRVDAAKRKDPGSRPSPGSDEALST
ncbi:PaaI family thioesterase [Noviherbaspirillum galbum]|uniref:PaaI family thioesterase n=1 Tax=Noviherbaspirillum galbum TaxID=2709383 RepID=A0A6B3SM14_9BURK|nr:PaaI family thioesterase [Noviherbaspirillum galbum]NEX59716.1 PaaI family thioesterase [Noviherbaspirillum galbum]